MILRLRESVLGNMASYSMDCVLRGLPTYLAMATNLEVWLTVIHLAADVSASSILKCLIFAGQLGLRSCLSIHLTLCNQQHMHSKSRPVKNQSLGHVSHLVRVKVMTELFANPRVERQKTPCFRFSCHL